MRLIIQKSYADMSKWAASLILKRITDFKPTEERPFVLGLPTGSTPIGTYKELVNLYREGKISFKNVVHQRGYVSDVHLSVHIDIAL